MLRNGHKKLCQGEIRLIYVDQSHFHQEFDLGYTWAPVSKPVWGKSFSPLLSTRINWYGTYDFTAGRCLIWHNGPCNSEQTVQFLAHLAQEKVER